MSEYELTDEEYNGLMPNKEQLESYLKEPDDELAASLSENEKRLVAKFILFGGNVAKAAQDKLMKHYRDMTPEKLREEVAVIIRYADTSENPVLIPESLKQDYLKAADQILSLVNGYYSSLTPEKLRDEIFQIVDSANFKDGPTSEEALTQILSLVMAYYVEKVKGIENPFTSNIFEADEKIYNPDANKWFNEAIQAVLKVIKEVE